MTEELRIVKEKNLAMTLANREKEKKDMDVQRRLVDAETKLREYRAGRTQQSMISSKAKSSIDYEVSEIDELTDDRVHALEKRTRLLSKRNSKDEKLLKLQKSMFDKHVLKQNQRINQLELIVKEKDKEIRM